VIDVDITALKPDQFETVLPRDRYRRFREGLDRAAKCFKGRTLWCLNSTAKGGGVAEMLQSLLGYLAGAGIDARWSVIEADDEFFALTKRIHNRLHGEPGDEGPLGPEQLKTYERALQPSAEELVGRVESDDVVIVHDPQPAGLIPALKKTGATVVWRCHIGVDRPDETVREAWNLLRPFVAGADACVFSRPAYAWEGLDEDRVGFIAPSIDAFSPKNQILDENACPAILRAAGILDEESEGEPAFVRQDGTRGTVSRQAKLMEDQPLTPSDPIVLQVSRWDRLKDPIGVLRGFADHVPPDVHAQLVLAGPWTSEVSDDPEGAEVFGEVAEAWKALPSEARARAHLTSLPMEDTEENGAIVNALQRRADVVVQKSLREGFGLTVAEAMWKARPTVASRVGGIQDQIEDGTSGLLVDDPEDLAAFGSAVTRLLRDREAAKRIGRAAHERVRDEFLPPRHLLQWATLIQQISS
jgi:trehalose synthase